MKKRLFFSLLVVILFSANSKNAFSQEKYNVIPKPDKIGIYEHLGATLPDVYMINNADSSRVNINDLIDKPTVFSFIYYSCPGLCSPLLGGLSEVIEKTDMVLGIDYQVITISMNADDRPSLGKAKKKNYVDAIKTKKISEKDWIWLTGDSAAIAKITDALGFKFKRDGKDFAHAAAIMVVSPKKKITRYLNGTYFLEFDLKMAIVEAADEKVSPTINKVLKFCFSYDPTGKKYVMNITRVSASLILIFAAIFLVFMIFGKKRKRKFGSSK